MHEITDIDRPKGDMVRFYVRSDKDGRTYHFLAEEYRDIPNECRMVVSPLETTESERDLMIEMARAEYGIDHIDF